MSIESGRYVRIEDNGQQNDSGGDGRTRIQDKIRQPSCFLAYGEQVSGWALFFFYAPIFAHMCISRLHGCITKPDNAPILHPRLQNAWTCQEKCSRETPKVWNWMKFETERSVAEWSFKFRRLLMRPAPAAFCERPPAASRPDCSCRLEAGCSK